LALGLPSRPLPRSRAGMCQQGCQQGVCNPCGCGACNGCRPPRGPANGWTAEEWDDWTAGAEGGGAHRWWADWIPTPDGQRWCYNKRWEACRVVEGMISQWGLRALQAGEGVVDVGGDPGFVAAELLRENIPVTVVDPAFGASGKSDPQTSEILRLYRQFEGTQFRLIRAPLNRAFVHDPKHRRILRGASAMVSLYPDEATDNCLYFSAAFDLRTVLMPCNECQRYFPSHNPTYEGFVQQCLKDDAKYSRVFRNATMKREHINDTPFCKVILQRTPVGEC